MLLTRECDYAVRILRALRTGELVNVAGIAESEDISTQITYKLTRKLEKSGILDSIRGVNGGYRLRVSLEDLTLLDVFRAVDQNMVICDCAGSGAGPCSRNTKENPCMVHLEFCRLQQMMVKEFSARSVAAVMAGQEDLHQAEEVMQTEEPPKLEEANQTEELPGAENVHQIKESSKTEELLQAEVNPEEEQDLLAAAFTKGKKESKPERAKKKKSKTKKEKHKKK